MQSDPSSSFQSSYTSTPTPTEGPVPLPEESPFLSDHGMGTPAPPPAPRAPVNPPSGLSQFPPASAVAPPAGQSTAGIPVPPPRPTASQAIPRNVVAPSTPAPIPGYGVVVQDNLSSFPMFMAAGGDDPFGATGRGSGAVPASTGNDLLDRLKTILVTTTDSLQGRLVEQYLGLVTAEALVPTDTLLEGAERTGRFSRYKVSQQKMKSLQQLVLAELKLEADKLGGNAVVGTKLNTTMDHGVVLVIATGTAVRVV